jgi:hypothetical protein
MEDVNVLTDEQTTQVEEVKEEVKETPKGEEVTTKVEVLVELSQEEIAKKKQKSENRFSKLLAERWQLKKENEELRKRVSTEVVQPKAPNIQKFVGEDGNVDEEKYNQAMAEYTEKFLEHRDTKKKQEEFTQVTANEEEIKNKAWEDVAAKVIEKYPDFMEVTNKGVYSPVLVDILKDKAKVDIEEDTTISADIAEYLGKNPVELAKVNRLSNDPVNMIIELGKIQGKLESLTKNVSNAPKPLETLDAEKGSLKEFEDFPDGKDDEWYAWRQKEKRKKLEQRK